MKFHFITLFPELVDQGMKTGVVNQAIKKGLLSYDITNPRDFTEDVHKTVDDRPYGGGDGMLMKAEPLQKALDQILKNPSDGSKGRVRVIYTSPQGQCLTQAKVGQLAQEEALLIICGRYGGIDQRIINHYVDEEISIGDYVLSGGELAGLVISDAVARQITGVLGNPESKNNDSFSGEASLLEAPQFTRPAEFLEQKVPEFLLSGDHARIEKYRWALSIAVTAQKRPDLALPKDQLKKALEILKELSADDLAASGVSLQKLVQ